MYIDKLFCKLNAKKKPPKSHSNCVMTAAFDGAKELALNANLRLQEILKSELKKIHSRLTVLNEERRLLRGELRRRANFKRQGKPTVPRTPGQRKAVVVRFRFALAQFRCLVLSLVSCISLLH